MIRLLLLLALLFNVTYASAEKYFIQFGSFKNLKGLEQNIANLPTSLRSHVVIIYSDPWYIPFAYYTSNKYALRAKVDWYKRYFKDAHIAHSSSMLRYPLVRNYAKKNRVKVAPPKREYIAPARVTLPSYQNVGLSKANYTFQSVQNLPSIHEESIRPTMVATPIRQVHVQPKIVTKKVVYKSTPKKDNFSLSKIKRYKHFTKEMLGGNHYYLAYKKEGANPNLLIKVSFENHEVTYQPVIGEMQMTKANYMVEDNKLYMFANTFTKNGSFSKLEAHRKNYFLVSSWANGKKLNTLRYYYKLNDAKKYLGLSTSNGLAEILSEGDYDDFFIDE